MKNKTAHLELLDLSMTCPSAQIKDFFQEKMIFSYLWSNSLAMDSLNNLYEQKDEDAALYNATYSQM